MENTNIMNVEQKAKLYATSLVEVLPHIGRKVPYICIPKGITELRRIGTNQAASDTERDFVERSVTTGKLCFIPDLEKELQKIEGQARYICKRSTIVQNYVLYSMYNDLAEKFDELKEKYFAKRDEIAAHWDEYMQSFSTGLMAYIKSSLSYNMLNDMDADLAKKTKEALDQSCKELYEMLMAQIPSKEDWMDSFRFSLEVREYPAAPGSLPGLDKKWEERTEELTKSLLSSQVEELFHNMNKLFQVIQESRSLTTPVNALVKSASNLLNHRIVDNAKLISVAEELIKFHSYEDDDDQMAEKAEKCMADILRIADGFHIVLDMNEMVVSKEYLLGA